MPFINQSTPPFEQTAKTESVADYVKQGWLIIADGPTGTQLKSPKKMKTLDKIVMIAGVACLFVNFILAGVFILMAIIDYAFLTNQETIFIERKS
jgi:hypothetical protein